MSELSHEDIEDLIVDAFVQDPQVLNYRIGPLEELGKDIPDFLWNEMCANAYVRAMALRNSANS